ncbi:MAG: O-antigen ligase family protein [Patescibacteria group bacterium]
MTNERRKFVPTWFLTMSQIFFLMLIFCWPLGTRLQWLGEFSYLGGVISDLTTYFVYVTDILLVLVILGWLIDIAIKFWRYEDWDEWNLNPWQGMVVLFFGGLAGWGLYSTVWAMIDEIALYKGLRLVGMWWLFAYIVLVVGKNKILIRNTWLVGLATLGIQAVWGIAQYIKQSGFGLWQLGESILGKTVAGVAKVDVDGEKIIRAYGSLPHANLFGVFMLLGLILILVILVYSGCGKNFQFSIFPSRDRTVAGNFQKISNFQFSKNTSTIILGVLLGLFLVGMLVSFSRSVWVAGMVIMVGAIVEMVRRGEVSSPGEGKGKNFQFSIFNFQKISNFQTILIGLFILLIATGLNWKVVMGRSSLDVGNDVSLQVRQVYDQGADWMIEKFYYGGVGLGNFVLVLPYFAGKANLQWWQYQPVHNVFKLVWSELGVFGYILLILLMVSIAAMILFDDQKKYPKYFWLSVILSMIFLMFFDHYFWDVWQGMMGWAVFLGVMVVGGSSKKT